MTFLPILLSDNDSSVHGSSPMSQPLDLYLSGSVFLVSFATPKNNLLE